MAKIKVGYALVDWHNICARAFKDFNNDPPRQIPKIVLKLQQALAGKLAVMAAGQACRVYMRVYYGWHVGREPTPVRLAFERFGDAARNIGRVSFSAKLGFGNELLCASDWCPLYSTKQRGGGQKMVDTAIVADALHLCARQQADHVLIVSDDTDFIPAVVTARAWGTPITLLRTTKDDLRHITGANTTPLIQSWSLD